MLSLILGFVTGLAGPISNIVGRISDLKIAQVTAQTDTERNKINQQIQESEDRKSVLVAEAGHRVVAAINATMRVALTLGPLAVLMKLMLWDKVIGSFWGCGRGGPSTDEQCYTFNTDPLDAYQWGVITAVIAFYFIYDLASRARR